jgi:hypothetical protein
MLKRILHAAALTIGVTAPIQAIAYTVPDASYFNKLCKGNRAEQSLVTFYVQGLLDGYALSAANLTAFFMAQDQERDFDRNYDRYSKRAEKVLKWVCIPDEVDLTVIQKAFCAHLAAHPLESDQTANSKFAEAMAKTWPCP